MKKEGGKLNNTFANRICGTKQNERDGSFTKQGPEQVDRIGYKPEPSARTKARKI